MEKKRDPADDGVPFEKQPKEIQEKVLAAQKANDEKNAATRIEHSKQMAKDSEGWLVSGVRMQNPANAEEGIAVSLEPEEGARVGQLITEILKARK